MGDRLILLGTAGGAETTVRPTGPTSAAYGISSAVVVGGRIYLVDVGQGSSRQLTLLDPLGVGHRRVMHDLAAIFLTHLHSDHTMDLVNFAVCGYLQGWPDGSLPVYGPWPRLIKAADYPKAQLEPGSTRRVPGTTAMVDNLISAFAADSVDRALSGRKATLDSRMHGVDIAPPSSGVPLHSSDELDPWVVHEDDRVRVTTILVDHGNMAPALAYRFDCDSGAVVFSGDTAPSSNLVRLATGADILVHEVIDPEFGRREFGEPPYPDHQRILIEGIYAKHTLATEVGAIAQRAGVRKLVLSHYAPSYLPAEYWRGQVSGFHGAVHAGQDLDSFDLH
ncbi:MAG: MBL fold metallo-hydrolase [Propionibacteriaceae bacterium]|nr:MBL fold metallo-hydrolase [Propionibacteriaceae bacterium]